MYERYGTVCTGAVASAVQQLVGVACTGAVLRLYGSYGTACTGAVLLNVYRSYVLSAQELWD